MAKRPEKSAVSSIPRVVTTEALAGILGLTARRIRQLAEEGILAPESRDKWNLAASVQAVIASRSQPRETSSQEDMRFLKARELQLKLMDRAGTIKKLAAEDARQYVLIHLGKARAEVLRLPSRITCDPEAKRQVERFTDLISDQLERDIRSYAEVGRPSISVWCEVSKAAGEEPW